MHFNLCRYSATRLEIAAGAGHTFAFEFVRSGNGRELVLTTTHWMSGRPPADSEDLRLEAVRFARQCTVSCGLA